MYMVLTDGVHGSSRPCRNARNERRLDHCCILPSMPSESIYKARDFVLTSITAMAAASRILLAPLPNVQPLTVMCLIMGASLGARRGMAFAVMATMLSNTVLSHGWWTLFQATGWAAVAFAGSRLNLVIQNKVVMKQLIVASIVNLFLIRLVGFTLDDKKAVQLCRLWNLSVEWIAVWIFLHAFCQRCNRSMASPIFDQFIV